MARAAGVRVSFDCNYRPSLWQAWSGDAPRLLHGLCASADLVFADDRALGLPVSLQRARLVAKGSWVRTIIAIGPTHLARVVQRARAYLEEPS